MKEWTVMVYMAGDNNLSEDMISGLNAIKDGVAASMAAASTGANNVAFLVEYDGSHPSVPTYQIDLTYETGVKYDPLNLKEEIPPDDEGKSTEEKINLFIQWAVKKRPAYNYALIVSGHSDGFRGRTLLLDDSEQSVASLQELTKQIGLAISQIKTTDPTIFQKNNLDLLCFDSCVMSSIEVMYEFKDCSHYWIGSQGSIPNYTWDYLGIAGELTKRQIPDLTPVKVCKVILDKVEAYNLVYAFQGRSTDICAADLTNIEDVAVRIWSIASSLLTISFKYPAWLSEYWFRLLNETHSKCQTFMCEQSVDILDYFECLSAICENAKTEFQNISTTPSGTITDFLKDIGNLQLQILAFKVPYASLVIDVRTTGGDYRFANGVSVFMPWSLLALSMSLPRYAELNFIKDTTAGQYWVFYVLVQLILEARPPISILQPPPILTARDYETMKTKNVTAITSKTLLNPTIKMSSIDILDAINLILDPNGTGQGVKDNPPRSKGTDEHIEYFRTVKNFWPPLKP